MKEKYTVGFLVSGIMDEFTEEMAKGIMSAMKREDSVNLVVIPVKYIDRDLSMLPDKYEFQYKTTSKFLTKDSLDAVIVAKDCIGCLTEEENILRFMESINDIPTILIASRMKGYAGVTFDNRSGIAEGLEYMITKLGVKKLCMLGGEIKNSDVLERRNIFFETLRKHGLECSDKQFAESELTHMCRKEAAELLDNNPDVEAVFCVNDMVASGMYDELRARGLEPGHDILVMGFDNAVFGAMANPSLSTVDADAKELGRYAYQMTLRLIHGEKVGEETIPTRFIKRDSLGETKDSSMDSELAVLNKDNLHKYFADVFYRSIRDGDAKLEDEYISFMNKLIDFVYSDEHDPKKLTVIQMEIDRFLKDGAMEYADIDELILYIDKIQSAVMQINKDVSDKEMIYDFISVIYKRLLKHLGNETVQYEDRIYNVIYSMKTLVKDSLNFTYGNDRSYSTALASINLLNIKNAYLYIYEKPILHLEKEEFVVPKNLRLKAVMNDGEVEDVPYNKQRIRREKIFNNPFIRQSCYQMVLMPLYFGDTLYGVILYDLNDTTFMNGEFLANQFGTTARMINILKMNNEIQKQLEENLAVMSKNNIELDKLSRNDVLTGILNRRGFNSIAKGIINDNRGFKRDTIVSYVDMNNLKIINDRFGHDDGDFALKTISQILTDIVDQKGVVGRIGGDEYALAYYGELSEEELREVIRERFDAFNIQSDKDYNVTVSCGFYRIKADENISLEDALAMADQDLYVAKQNKDNRILKNI